MFHRFFQPAGQLSVFYVNQHFKYPFYIAWQFAIMILCSIIKGTLPVGLHYAKIYYMPHMLKFFKFLMIIK